MSAIKQIQCPACGANSTFKQTDGSYRCNYCQSNFELKENLKRPETPKTTFTFDKADIKPVKRGCGLVGLMIVISVIGVGLSVFLNFKNNPAITESIGAVFNEWQKESLSIYQSFVGSKGPVIWEISSQTRNKLDSVKYTIEIIDPKTKNVLSEKPVFETMTWTESFQFSKKINNQFFQIGDIAYNCSEENGLIGFNIYNFNMDVTQETLGKKYAELSSGISKADYMWYKKAFHLTNNKGDEFVYYPESGTIRAKKEDDASYKKDTLTDTKVYLSEEKQARLFLMRRRGDKTRDELSVNDRIATEYAKEKSYFKSSYHISLFKQLGIRVFFKAEPLMRINGAMVFAYADNLSKKSKNHLECVDQDGKTVWINSDAVLQELNNNSNDGLSFEYRHNNEFLTISVWGAKRKTHCFDLKTGKLLWSYSPEK